MTQSYTNKEVMAKLDLTSRSAFYHFKRKHPHAFVVVSQPTASGDGTRYDKRALDNFLATFKPSKS